MRARKEAFPFGRIFSKLTSLDFVCRQPVPARADPPGPGRRWAARRVQVDPHHQEGLLAAHGHGRRRGGRRLAAESQRSPAQPAEPALEPAAAGGKVGGGVGHLGAQR